MIVCLAGAMAAAARALEERPEDWYENTDWLGKNLASGAPDLPEADLRLILDTWEPRLSVDEDRQYALWVLQRASLELAEALEGHPDRREERLEALLARFEFETLADVKQHDRTAYAIARVQWKLGRTDEATRWLLDHVVSVDARPTYRRLGCWLVASIALDEARLDEAREWIDRGQTGSDIDSQYVAMEGLRARLLMARGTPDLARDVLTRAMRLANERPIDIGTLLDLHIRRADLELASERYAAAVDEITRSLGTLRIPAERVDARTALLVNRGLAHLNLALGDESHAAAAERDFEQVLATPGAAFTHRASALLRLAQLSLMGGDWTRASSRLAQLDEERTTGGLDLSARDDAFGLALEARVSVATEQAEERLVRIQEELHRAIDRLIATWMQQSPPAGGTGHLSYQWVRIVLGAAIDLQRRLAPGPPGVDAALELIIQAQRASGLVRTVFGIDASMAAVRRELVPPDGGMLVYLPAWERTHLFVVTADASDHVVLDGRSRLVPLLGRYTSALRTPPHRGDADRETTLEELGPRLSAALLPPSIAEPLRGRTDLVIVGGDLLNRLAFETLPFDGAPLGDRFAISYLPSLPFGLALAARPPRATEADTLLVAGASPSPQVMQRHPYLGPLSPTRGELRALTSPFEQARQLIDELATPTRLCAEIGDVRYAQILGHGVFDNGASALVLGADGPDGDGLLSSSRVATLSAPPLVALLACRAGAGPVRDSGAAHLGGAFLSAGADAVVLSYNDIYYESTVALMTTFNREVARGITPAEALRRARVDLRGDGERRDPFHHGLVHVVGLGHRSVFPGRDGDRFAAEPESPSNAATPTLIAILAAIALMITVALLERRGRS